MKIFGSRQCRGYGDFQSGESVGAGCCKPFAGKTEDSGAFYYMENLKVAEIAEQLHESVSSIKSKLMRARKYLKKELEDFVL